MPYRCRLRGRGVGAVHAEESVGARTGAAVREIRDHAQDTSEAAKEEATVAAKEVAKAYDRFEERAAEALQKIEQATQEIMTALEVEYQEFKRALNEPSK